MIETFCLQDELRHCLVQRRILTGIRCLEEHLDSLWEQDSPQLLFQAAQWIDLGWRDVSMIVPVLARMSPAVRGSLRLCDYAAVRCASGMAALMQEDLDSAISHFDAVLGLEEDLADRELVAITYFWKARCQRKRGEYDKALMNVARGRDMALQLGLDRLAAVIRVVEAWLAFQAGKHKESLGLLAEAESVLRNTEDVVVLGNIQSTYGRIYRQEARYERATEHFANAIEEYRKIDRQHPNLARSLANIAYVKRLVALELKRKIEAEPARKRSPGQTLLFRERFEQLQAEAFAHLNEAAEIYGVHPNHRGSGTVHLDRGLLYFDNGAFDVAEHEALEAFALGEQKDDSILRARARLLQCMVENARLEEGIDDDPQRHAEAAMEAIREALEYARTTQNRRLLARVHTWLGLTLSNEFFASPDAAAEAMNAASSFLDHHFHDTAWQDLRTLKARLSATQTIDATLLAWSQGEVGNRSFREISEQFAEILIPKVWELENRRIARVASRLSISPKKVRRALSRAGLLRK